MFRSLLSACLLAFASLTGCVHTEVTPGSAMLPNDSIVVVGQGEAYGKPDIVHVQLGVEARADDPRVAIQAANTKMTQLMQTLEQAGVKPEDMQTRDFNIHSERYDEGAPAPMESMVEPALAPDTVQHSRAQPEAALQRGPKIAYRVSNMLHVTLRNLDTVGEALSQAVGAGANQAWGVSFDLEDDEPLAQKARAEAVADARARAEELAKLSGVRLGRVLAVAEEDMAMGPMPAASFRHAMAEAKSVPIAGGELEVRRSVRVVFAIDRDDAKD